MTAAEKQDVPPEDPPALVAALEELAAGRWPVVITSIHAPGGSPGKRPIGTDWALTRPTVDSLRAKFARYRDAGVGLRLGPKGGVIDLDVDDPALAAPVLARMFPGGLPATRGWSNAGGRFHLLFNWDARLERYGKAIIKGVEGEGGEVRGNPNYLGLELRLGHKPDDPDAQYQTVIPPSPTADGSPRTWNEHAEILDLPESAYIDLDAYVLGPAGGRPAESPRRGFNILQIYPPSAGDPVAAYVARAVNDEIAALASAPRGDRNEQLNRSAFALGQLVGAGALPLEEAAHLLAITAQQVGLDDAEIPATIRSGLDAGREEPRDLSHVGGGEDTNKTKETNYRRREPTVGDPSSSNSFSSSPPPRGKRAEGSSNSFSSYASHVDDDEDHPVTVREWPAPPEEAAWRGPAGWLAQACAPHTEADPVGILIQALVGFGNMVGRSSYWQVNATRHYTNNFVATVGPTGAGRKGTAWDIVAMALSYCDPLWAMTRVTGGLVSGEGMIWEVRDKVEVEEEVREKGMPPRMEPVVKDAGVADKRLLCVETELGGLLKVLTREGNTLSATIRQCWDTGMLRSMTKNAANRATDAHISIIGHITEIEVNRYLTQVDAANGFANRFLWLAVRKSQDLPDAAAIPAAATQQALAEIKAAAEFVAGNPRRFDRSPEAAEYWRPVYKVLNRGKPGMLGSILGRAVPQTLRLALLYALLDRSDSIEVTHLESAYALWQYCERSALYIFGDSIGDKDADHLLSVLRSSPFGLTQTEINVKVYRRNKSKEEIARILGRLLEAHKVRSEVEDGTGGRSLTRWYARDSEEGKGTN